MKHIFFTFFLISQIIYAQDNWTIQSQGLSNSLYDIHFANTETGWSCGYDILLKTENGGLDWNFLNPPDASYSWNKIQFTDMNNGWLVGGNHTSDWIGKIYKTSNGGTTWNLNFSTNTARFEDAFFINSDEAIVIGIGDSPVGVVYKTVNGGATWEEKYTHDSILTTVEFYNESIGWIVGIDTVLYTDDGGETWELQNAPSSAFITDIHIVDEQTVFVSDGLGDIYKTTSSGSSWTTINVSSSELNNLHFIDDNAITVGDWGEFFTSNDFGATWEEGDFNTGHLYKIYFFNDLEAWIVGADGTILHSETGILKNTNEYKYEDIKIYPNPVQTHFKINSNIELSAIQILNTESKIVKHFTVIETEKYDISDLSSGVYFVKLISSQRVTYRKLIKH